jgi:hypothetical protein
VQGASPSASIVRLGKRQLSPSLSFQQGIAEEIMRSEATMEVHLEIPEEVARQLASDASGLARAALEAMALEGSPVRCP